MKTLSLLRFSAAFAITAAAAAVALTPAAAVGERRPTPSLEFLGEAIFPTGTVFGGTLVGGLSGITYDTGRGVFYSLSDDRSEFGPARFYTLRVDLGDGRLNPGDVTFTDVTTLRGADGNPFAPFSLDPEGIALTEDDTLVVTSEGDAVRLIAPFVRTFNLGGHSKGELPLPDYFEPTADGSSGIRNNLALESAGVTPNGHFLYVGMEGALIQDGPAASLTGGSPARLLRYNLRSGKLQKQFLYPVEPVAEPPVPAGAFAVSGLVELLPLTNHSLLALERSFSVGAGNTIRLYRVELGRAQDIDRFSSLAGLLGDIRPVEKALLLDLDVLGIPLDNVEGIAFGPELPDGRRSLVLVSDNNFSPAAFTQFLAFAYAER
jgi:3-phytase/alkaline phosphatase D